jgi:chlorite dismutase
MVLCVLLMRRILKLEYQVYDLNERLNLSDEEYIDLFSENTKLSLQVENFAKTRISENWYSEENEKRMNIIGQNGNDGEHYKNEKV